MIRPSISLDNRVYHLAFSTRNCVHQPATWLLSKPKEFTDLEACAAAFCDAHEATSYSSDSFQKHFRWNAWRTCSCACRSLVELINKFYFLESADLRHARNVIDCVRVVDVTDQTVDCAIDVRFHKILCFFIRSRTFLFWSFDGKLPAPKITKFARFDHKENLHKKIATTVVVGRVVGIEYKSKTVSLITNSVSIWKFFKKHLEIISCANQFRQPKSN